MHIVRPGLIVRVFCLLRKYDDGIPNKYIKNNKPNGCALVLGRQAGSFGVTAIGCNLLQQKARP